MVKWVRSRYERSRTQSYRDRNTGLIYKTATSTKPISVEPTYGHISGGDKFKVGNKSFSASQKKKFRYNQSKKRFIKLSSQKINSFKAV